MIGLFAMSQAFETIEDIYSTDEIDATVTRLLPTKEDMKTMFRVAPVTGLIGTCLLYTSKFRDKKSTQQ